MIANALQVLSASEPEPRNMTLRRSLTVGKAADRFDRIEGTDTYIHYYEDWHGLCVYVDFKLDVAGIGFFDVGMDELTDRADVELKLTAGTADENAAKIHELVLELSAWGNSSDKSAKLLKSLADRYTTSTKALLRRHRLSKFPTLEVDSGNIYVGIG